MAGGRRGVTLRSRLEREVHVVLKQLEASNGGAINTTGSAYDAIQRSNSSLKRQKKRPLEDAIDRVLLFQKQEADDSDDSEAAIEAAEEAEAADNARCEEGRFLLNRQMVKLWKQDASAGSGDSTGSSPAKKRRIEDHNGATSQSARATQDAKDDHVLDSRAASALNDQKQQSQPKKAQKSRRFTVQHVNDQVPLLGLGEVPNWIFTDAFTILRLTKAWEEKNWERNLGMIISGPSGMGKKLLVKNIACQLGVPLITLDDCFAEDHDRIEKCLIEAFDAAISLAPSIICVGDIEQHIPQREVSDHENHQVKTLERFTRQMERLRSLRGEASVLPIATTSDISQVAPRLCQKEYFSQVYKVQTPRYQDRLDILRSLTRDIVLADDIDLGHIAAVTQCYVASDLSHILDLAIKQAARLLAEGSDFDPTESQKRAAMRDGDYSFFQRSNFQAEFGSNLSMKHFEKAMEDFTPSLRREGFATIPCVTWDHIGALHDVRKQLYKSIIGPIKEPSLFAKFGLTANAGVLLWGPPGCGKTLLAQAVAHDAHASFILINGPEVLNKYVGESERAVRDIFQRARSAKPCILFFDEIDSIVPPREKASSEYGARLVNALLTELDGARDRDGIYIMGTTNRPHLIDEAILRPGRLGTHIFIDLPTPQERVEILRTIYRTRHSAPSPTTIETLAKVALDKRCTGFSGADLGALHEAAGEAALERYLSRRAEGGEEGSDVITDEDWQTALDTTRPSVKDPASYRKKIE